MPVTCFPLPRTVPSLACYSPSPSHGLRVVGPMEGVRDLPVSNDVLRDVAAAQGVCVRPELRRVTDRTTGDSVVKAVRSESFRVPISDQPHGHFNKPTKALRDRLVLTHDSHARAAWR